MLLQRSLDSRTYGDAGVAVYIVTSVDLVRFDWVHNLAVLRGRLRIRVGPGKRPSSWVIDALVETCSHITIALNHRVQLGGIAGSVVRPPAQPAKLARPVAIVFEIDAPV